jgi:hypothetical protein
MKYKDLSDLQLKKLCRMRLANRKAEISITKIKIEDKRLNPITEEFCVSFIVDSKEWASSRESICFTKFYPNEFIFMQKIGIKF